VTAPLVGPDGSPDSASRRKLPTLGTAAIYATLGRLTPRRWRYNKQLAAPPSIAVNGVPLERIEATTGALMLITPTMRARDGSVFDESYWMYGEDLQLCLDCAGRGLDVLIVDHEPSHHQKGASSGWPRSRISDRAFHQAMWIYYRKNISPSRLADPPVWAAIRLKYLVSRFKAAVVPKLSKHSSRFRADSRGAA
jgi:GT2 family glycosyltransferase